MVKFGVAGYPPAHSETPFKKDRMKIFEWLHHIGLDAFEAQMTYGPRTSEENCKIIHSLSEEFSIKVSVHAAYYIVLTSDDPGKVRRSIETLKKTFELADLMGADVIVLHPGSYYSLEPARIFDTLCKNLYTFFQEMGQSHIGLFLETAGKKGQLGSVEEILALAKNIKGCFPCIDFGHVHARAGGCLKKADAIDRLFDQLRENGFFENGKQIHFHYTPIHYGAQGEITHKAIEDTYPEEQRLSLFSETEEDRFYHPRYEPIARNFCNLNTSVTVISETHNSQERGALALKKSYHHFISQQK